MFCDMADKGNYPRPEPPSEETSTDHQVEEDGLESHPETEKADISVKSTPPKKDWKTNMLQDDHYQQIYTLSNERKSYEFEYFPCANIKWNELKEAKLENKKTQQISRMRPLFGQLKWNKGGENIFVWPDKQFVLYKQKEMPLGAITKCCLSICYIGRDNRKEENGPEAHWCPAENRWFASHEVRFVRQKELEVDYHNTVFGTREFGTGHYF